MKKCCVCGSSKEELRPYGPDGAPICFPCATTPAREAATKKELDRRLVEAAKGSRSGIVLLGGSDGPKHFDCDCSDCRPWTT